MTGGQQMLLASPAKSNVQEFDVVQIGDSKGAPTKALGSLSINGDGVLGFLGNTSAASPYWYLPQTPNIGQQFWVKLTVTAGSNPNEAGSAPVGSIVAIGSTGRTWGWSAVSTTITATCTVTIYGDAAGSSIAWSDTFTVNVRST